MAEAPVDNTNLNEDQKVPAKVQERISRGRNRMRQGSAKRNECLKFWRSEQYHWTDQKGNLNSLPTTTNYYEQSGKPPQRQRTTRNLIFDVVEREVALSTSRIPSYQVSPSTTDPEDIGAARLAEKVALYGYDKWHIRAATEEVVRYGVIADEGFAWPYFDNQVGPFIQGTNVGIGDVRIRVFGPNEVYWEPGLNFEDSRWHCVEQARDPEAIYQMEGYTGGKLTPDAQGSESLTSESTPEAKLVLVSEYLERPCPEYPQGRWIVIANGRVVIPERPYPCADYDGEPIDEPILHKLSYARDPDSDRDQGLVRHLLDAQRTINAAASKSVEWLVLALNPQLLIRNGGLAKGQRLTDEPGAVYNVVGNGEMEWRPVPPVPQELFQIKGQAESDIARIAAQNDIPGNVESARGIQALIERDTSRRAAFIANLAEFHSRLMRHCLYLVARHYTEERLLKIRGRFGPEAIRDFTGSQLRGQVDVRVYPDSIEPRTKQAMEQRIMNYAQLGWVSPEAAMAAINSGTAEGLIESYELDLARANDVIQKIKDGSFMDEPSRRVFPGEAMEIDPQTGEEIQVAEEVPGWIPRPFDNVRVHKQVFEDFMKTTDYDGLDEVGKEAAALYYDTLLKLEAEQAARDQAAQQQMAEGLGMNNAAKPQQAAPLPSLPGGETPPQ
jgi:hypothetical protein